MNSEQPIGAKARNPGVPVPLLQVSGCEAVGKSPSRNSGFLN